MPREATPSNLEAFLALPIRVAAYTKVNEAGHLVRVETRKESENGQEWSCVYRFKAPS